MAKASGLSVSSVQRIWRGHGLQPHRVRQFKLSNDPRFVDKLRDVVGLYVDPPAHAIVLSLDEKSQIQALDRTQPGLPLKKGRAGTMTHDYKRHGTTTLFAALNVLDGTVIGRNMQRHRHQEFIRFLNAIEKRAPAGKTIQAIVDNYATHKHPKVRQWLARHPRWTFHFNAHFGILAQRRRGFFRDPDKAAIETRRVPIDRRSPSRDQPLPRRVQSTVQTLRLDRRSKQNHRRCQTRAPSVKFDPLVCYSGDYRLLERGISEPASKQFQCLGNFRCRRWQDGDAISTAYLQRQDSRQQHAKHLRMVLGDPHEIGFPADGIEGVHDRLAETLGNVIWNAFRPAALDRAFRPLPFWHLIYTYFSVEFRTDWAGWREDEGETGAVTDASTQTKP